MTKVVYKETHDDWYPSFKIHRYNQEVNLVEVSLRKIHPIDEEWRVCIWGDDDCGMERDWNNYNEALEMFLIILGWEYVDMTELRVNGFVSA